jgi:hypothetical protein
MGCRSCPCSTSPEQFAPPTAVDSATISTTTSNDARPELQNADQNASIDPLAILKGMDRVKQTSPNITDNFQLTDNSGTVNNAGTEGECCPPTNTARPRSASSYALPEVSIAETSNYSCPDCPPTDSATVVPSEEYPETQSNLIEQSEETDSFRSRGRHWSRGYHSGFLGRSLPLSLRRVLGGGSAFSFHRLR